MNLLSKSSEHELQLSYDLFFLHHGGGAII